MVSNAKPVFHDPSNLGQWTKAIGNERNSLQFQKGVEAVAHNNLLNDNICRAIAENQRNHTQASIHSPVSQVSPADQVVPSQVVPSQWNTRTGNWTDKGGAWNEQNGTATTGVPVFTMPRTQTLQQLSKQHQVHSSGYGLILQKPAGGAPAIVRVPSSGTSSEIPPQQSNGPPKPSHLPIPQNNVRKRPPEDLSEFTNQPPDTRPRKSISLSPPRDPSTLSNLPVRITFPHFD
jgi:hypothetical protein